jgi:ubiquinol-cytochrome c reductase cytochrome b subunit
MAKHQPAHQDTLNLTKSQTLGQWIDTRLPSLGEAYRKHLSEYYAPKNLNWWYIFGALALLVLIIQIVSGIFLVMHYKPDAQLAFASVEYIMREVPGGWFIRYMHSTGASAFFVVVYLHMFRGMIYGSYRTPRELVWIFGCAIFLCLMAEAFMGYLLPWGQMSYWGAQVIINLFAAIPYIGPDLALFIRGDYVVGDATLNRFFSLHVVAVPLVLIGLVVAHIFALHDVGSNNPDGVDIKGPHAPKDTKGKPLDGIPFHPYYTAHDVFAMAIFLIFFFGIVFFAPEMKGYFLEFNNFISADPLVTPEHIAPVWYFTPFYSMLRATTDVMVWVLAITIGISVLTMWIFSRATFIRKGLLTFMSLLGVFLLFTYDAKFWGVVVMGAAVIILFFLPWLDKSPVRSIRYRPSWHKWIYATFIAFFFLLGYLGIQSPTPLYTVLAQIGTVVYFAFFLLMPWWSQMGIFKQPPERIILKPH